MEDSLDHHDPDYGMSSLTPGDTMGQGSSDDAFGSIFQFGLPGCGTVEPSSLQVTRVAHDDSCIDTCAGGYNPGSGHRGTGPSAMLPSRTRQATSSVSFPYTPNSDFFSCDTQTMDSLYPLLFPDVDLKSSWQPDMRGLHNIANFNQTTGNSFSNFDFGGVPHHPAADDCASINCSQFSCSSQCCSTQVCQNEFCEGNGTPCDNLNCFENSDIPQSLEDMLNMHQSWSTSEHQQQVQADSHQAPCNHTHAEHDVAITLRDLRIPGVGEQPQIQGYDGLECAFYPSETDVTENSSTIDCHCDLTSPVLTEGPAKLHRCCGAVSNPTGEQKCHWAVNDASGKHICGQVFADAQELQAHLGKDHIALMSSKTKYVCLWQGCSRRDDQVFASRNKLRRHISTHTFYKPFKCEICDEGFSAQQALDQHIRTHTGEKPYKCDVEGCGKSFKQKSALTMHKRTHTGEKPLECEICGKRFCESSNLSKHRKTHNPEFKYKCDEPGCTSEFIRIDQLRRHQATHERAKKKGKARKSSGLLTPVSTIS